MPQSLKLTKEEQKTVAIAKVAASNEVDLLIKIIERLIGEEIPAADEGGLG